jgi:hypothetical protein
LKDQVCEDTQENDTGGREEQQSESGGPSKPSEADEGRESFDQRDKDEETKK